MTRIRRYARSAGRSIMRRRTTIGAAGRIRVNTEGRCGGAVVKLTKKHMGASSQSMKARKMMRMMLTLMINFKIS